MTNQNNKAVENTPANLYCGNARTFQSKYGDFTKISMSKEDINTIVKYMKDGKKDWVNIAIKEKKSKEPNKPTHYLQIDTFEKTEVSNSAPEPVKTDDLPF